MRGLPRVAGAVSLVTAIKTLAHQLAYDIRFIFPAPPTPLRAAAGRVYARHEWLDFFPSQGAMQMSECCRKQL